ncbi:MAG TPA: hypothetical protein VEU30_08370 [Thermoanaerobaculia bacterium]|nr:hypothetical protein [Thermoanaerobaculia bacterium]
MARYLKKFTHVGSMGPTEERGFAVWAGYDIVGVDEDLSAIGLIHIEDAPADHGVTTFTRVEPDDAATHEKLGIRKR